MNPQEECWVSSAKNPHVRGCNPFLLLGFLEDAQHPQHLSVGYPPAWRAIFGDSAFAAARRRLQPHSRRRALLLRRSGTQSSRVGATARDLPNYCCRHPGNPRARHKKGGV